MSYLGIACSLSGFAYALLVIIVRLRSSIPVQGWSSLMVAVLVLGGVQMMMLGVLGEYLWRTLEAARRRPVYFLEATSDMDSPPALQRPQPVEHGFGT
jgi:dolichol-phosphate mannosyltransferase